MKNKNKNAIFAKNKNDGTERDKTELDYRQTMERSAESGLVERQKQWSGIYSTIEAANLAGINNSVRSIEELEELEARGINPYWNARKFRNELKKQAKQNGVWLDSSYLEDKTLIHDRKKTGTSEK